MSAGEWDHARRREALGALSSLLTKTHPDREGASSSPSSPTRSTTSDARAEAPGHRATRRRHRRLGEPHELRLALQPGQQQQARHDRRPRRNSVSLIATDVLSEGQNLQDCAIVVNYDLPWAIIRLVQRPAASTASARRPRRSSCYSFLPADGVERIIRLRARVRQRLRENAEVVGTDEAFFEDDGERQELSSTSTTRTPASSTARPTPRSISPPTPIQIWKNAIDAEPGASEDDPRLPPVVLLDEACARQATSAGRRARLSPHRRRQRRTCLGRRERRRASPNPVRDPEGCRAARPTRRRLPRLENHHELVAKAVEDDLPRKSTVGGSLAVRPAPASAPTSD